MNKSDIYGADYAIQASAVKLCSYCGCGMPGVKHRKLKKEDDSGWTELKKTHADNCVWVLTKGEPGDCGSCGHGHGRDVCGVNACICPTYVNKSNITGNHQFNRSSQADVDAMVTTLSGLMKAEHFFGDEEHEHDDCLQDPEGCHMCDTVHAESIGKRPPREVRRLNEEARDFYRGGPRVQKMWPGDETEDEDHATERDKPFRESDHEPNGVVPSGGKPVERHETMYDLDPNDPGDLVYIGVPTQVLDAPTRVKGDKVTQPQRKGLKRETTLDQVKKADYQTASNPQKPRFDETETHPNSPSQVRRRASKPPEYNFEKALNKATSDLEKSLVFGNKKGPMARKPGRDVPGLADAASKIKPVNNFLNNRAMARRAEDHYANEGSMSKSKTTITVEDDDGNKEEMQMPPQQQAPQAPPQGGPGMSMSYDNPITALAQALGGVR